MHELSLCQSIVGVVERAAAGRRVTAVHLQVGQLRQVVPDTLLYCWGLVTDTTPLAGSRLEIDHVPVVVDCHACGAASTVEHVLVLRCGACDSPDIAVRTGEELLVTSMDVVPYDAPQPTRQEA